MNQKTQVYQLLQTEANMNTIHIRQSLSILNKDLHQLLTYYFLPNGYPYSVNNGYLKFTLMSTTSAFWVTLLSFISTQALFVALGSTITQATLYSAAFTWVLKDGIGQLGGIIFAAKYGNNFDEEVKKWRFMSMLLLNWAIIVEMFTLKFPTAFIYLASLANIWKSITILGSSATRASINLYFAKDNNIGDIAGKTVTQYTTASLLGMGAGLQYL